ncbi:MAG: RNA polymerase sigma factor [Acidobacteriota bacterium]
MIQQPVSDSVSDDDLLPRIAAGDAAAFTALFRRRQPDVYRFALRMTGSPAVAEDVTQDVFLAVMHDAGRYQRGRSTVTAWLCGIARNQALRRWDRERNLVQSGLAADSGDEPPPDAAIHPSALDDLTTAERTETLHKAVLSLPVRYREAVVLCDLQELTYAEAAAALECAVGTVRSRLHRGRALLAAKLRGDAANGGSVPVQGDKTGPLEAGRYRSGPEPVTRCVT